MAGKDRDARLFRPLFLLHVPTSMPRTLRFGALLVPALALGLAACDGVSDTSPALSAADAQVAALLVGQALGDQSEGMVSDIRDLDAGFDSRGIVYGDGPMSGGMRPGGPGGHGGPDDWRGDRQNGVVTYDSTTGTHRIAYDRAMTGDRGSDALHVNLAYVYTTATGAFVRNPRTDRARIDRIVFDGTRSGAMRRIRPNSTATDTSSFSREATWTLGGLTGATSTFSGDQLSTGSGSMTTPDGTVRVRGYTVRLRTTDATITRGAATTANGRPEMALTGTLAYETVFTRTAADGTTEETRAEGTIDLATDGPRPHALHGQRPPLRPRPAHRRRGQAALIPALPAVDRAASTCGGGPVFRWWRVASMLTCPGLRPDRSISAVRRQPSTGYLAADGGGARRGV